MLAPYSTIWMGTTIFGAIAGVRLVSRPNSTAVSSGMEKKPQHSLIKFIIPVPKFMTNGAIAMATTPTIVPNTWPVFTTFCVLAFLPQIGCHTFSVKMVEAEFRTELNEDKIAPNMTAAKKPISGFGIISITSNG